ncbi:MAG: hypothetical protein GWN00_15995 [Aliifodinibius sp.]|nr:hypothetical protein [Fodinibius sp.]NIV12549.1 hypothetical protein [Fodinibius sp.]NIY26251.1 hypothetical protein [Fodinibius sp.]
MPNSLKIEQFGISGLLTFSLPDVITPKARHSATGSVAPCKHERACLNRYSFKEYKLYNIISATINMDDFFLIL